MSRTPLPHEIFAAAAGGGGTSPSVSLRPAVRTAAATAAVGVVGLLLAGCHAEEATTPLSGPVMGNVSATVLTAESNHGMVHIDREGYVTSGPDLPGEGGPLIPVGEGYARPVGDGVQLLDADFQPTALVRVPGVVKVQEVIPQVDGSLLVKSAAAPAQQEQGVPLVIGRIIGDTYEHLTVAGQDASVTVCPDGRTHLLEVGDAAVVPVGADGWPTTGSENRAQQPAVGAARPARVRVIGPQGAHVKELAPTTARVVGGEFDCATGTWAGFVYEGDTYYRLQSATIDQPLTGDDAPVSLVVGDVCTDNFATASEVRQVTDSARRFIHSPTGVISVCDARTGAVKETGAACEQGRFAHGRVTGEKLLLSCVDGRDTQVKDYHLGADGSAQPIGAVKLQGLGEAIGRGGFTGALDHLEVTNLMPAAQ